MTSTQEPLPLHSDDDRAGLATFVLRCVDDLDQCATRLVARPCPAAEHEFLRASASVRRLLTATAQMLRPIRDQACVPAGPRQLSLDATAKLPATLAKGA